MDQFPRELIEIILAKLDRANDISSCALVCHQWLDIVNNHRGIETTIDYDDEKVPHNQLLRRFKNIRFSDSSPMALTEVEFKDLCQQAKVVEFNWCKFSNLDALKERILACGDLSHLEIIDPVVENSEVLIANDRDASKSLYPKVETLVLQTCEFQILETIHSASIDVKNMELDFSEDTREDTDLENLRSIVSLLQKHYQDKLRKLVVNNDPLLELLKGFSHLNLKKFNTFFDLDKQCMRDFISSQPTITHLEVTCIPDEVLLESAFRNLPLFNVLELNCYSLDDISVFSENCHHLRTLTYLKLDFFNDPESEGCDITFIAKIPALRKFYCWFYKPPLFVKLAPIENPMPQMKEFFLSSSGAEIDPESMWNIFHKMPNLEKITLYEETAKPCQFGQLKALKELSITSTIIEDDDVIQSMMFPKLKTLYLSHPKTLKWEKPVIFKYFPQIVHNCLVLSQIKFDSTVFKCNAGHLLHIGEDEIDSMISDLTVSYQRFIYNSKTTV